MDSDMLEPDRVTRQESQHHVGFLPPCSILGSIPALGEVFHLGFRSGVVQPPHIYDDCYAAEIDDEPGPQLELDADPKLQPKHKIFLSHSGAQKDFVEQLCEDLESFHHFPFFDKRNDSLPKGERFPNLIFQAAKQCGVAVVVLSEEFFTRTKWPMLELDAFVKAQKERDGYPRILPLFFKLTRAQCHERARRERWLEVWRGWARDDSRIVIEDWVNALNVFGPINDLEYKGEGEVSFRKSAWSAIIRLVPPPLQYDTTSLEGSERLCKVILDKFHKVKTSNRYGVRVVGVYGVGGLGKTTVCKALYNTQYAEHDGRVCLAELGVQSPEELQKQVLRELTQINLELEKDLQGDKAVHLLKERLHKHKVFLAIDNVWDTLDSREAALTFLQAGFHCESMVMVTARTRDILLRMNIDASDCIEMPELDTEEATKLFLHHAIPHDPQLESAQRDVVKQCVKRCRYGKGGGGGTSGRQYLPLAIKVLGGQLGACSDDPLDWRERLSNLNLNFSQDSVHPIFSILRRGYDSLTEAQQLLFMDVALFCPHPKSIDLGFMKHADFSSGSIFYWLSLLHNTSLRVTMENLQILKRRSLLEDLGDGLSRITLHDLYYEFAVIESQGMDFSKRRWLFADYETLSKITGEVFASTADVPEDLQQKPGLSCWPALKRIAICYSKLQSVGRSELKYCSNVVLLKLVKCPDLETVDLHDLGSLKFLEVDGCSKLKASLLGIEGMRKLVWLRWSESSLSYPCFPDFSVLKSLRVLELVSDYNRPDLPKSMLSSFPGLEECVNLVELRLWGHGELLAFPDLSRMVFLQKVWFGECEKASGLRGLSSKMTQLEELLLYCCEGVVELPGVEDLVSLKRLQLSFCGVRRSFPHLKKLTNLNTLVCYDFEVKKTLSIRDSVHGEELRCVKYDDLEELLDLSTLCALQVLRLHNWNMESLHEFRISHLTSLQILKCEWLDALREVPDLSTLSQIKVMSFLGCSALRSVLEANIQRLTTLQSLDVCYTSISTLPDLSNLKDLRALDFSGTSLTALPDDFARLATISEVRMNRCKFLRRPLLEFLGERVPEVQELAAMKALHSIYEAQWFAHVEGLHPSAFLVSRLLECLKCSANQSRLRELAASLLSTVCFRFGLTANRGFNIHFLEILGQVDDGVESVIKVFGEHKDAWTLFYVIVGFISIGHRCSALRASDTLHQISQRVSQFEEDNFGEPWDLGFLSFLYCLEIMLENPVVASAFGDQVAIGFFERIKLWYVGCDSLKLRYLTLDRIRMFFSAGTISERAYYNSTSIGDKLKELFLAKIDALLDTARLAFLSHGHCFEIVDTGGVKEMRAIETMP